MKLIAGLGNPGPEYEDTPHNAGFWFVDEVARQYHAVFKSEKKFHGEVAKFTLGGQDIWLLKPDTYMNLSGQAVQALANFFKIGKENILVAHDDLDLPPGTVRLKEGGGHGGHNGLRDIISKMGGNGFQRLRIGIGHPGDKNRVTSHVLKKAAKDDRIAIDNGIDAALKVLPEVLEGELSKAMNELHRG
ncbi:MAG: aminoacyl-tRNA hydrolase [Pseudomonadota bacterium]|nr:aminoacyl-tRNA hydrolase [Pseudomonadota bacterium]